MNLALLYVRVSSEEQKKDGYSLDAQERLGDEYAQRKGLEIVHRWKVSESAWREERTAFSELLEYAKNHPNVGHIIFDVTDRMTRNDIDKIKIYSLIKLYDKTIHFSRSNKALDKRSGSEDEFMLDIEVAVAKKMSNDISRKTQMGMQEKAAQGLYPSIAPIGYKNNLTTHLIEVDPATAPYVQQAFKLMATGNYSLFSLAEQLRREGFRNRRGGQVGKSTLAYFLSRSIYYGVYTWKGKVHQGSHTPLITKELFDDVQRVMHRSTHPSVRDKLFAFNNLMICGVCECKVLGERKKQKYHYYHCTFSKGRHERGAYIPENRLAMMFEEPVKRVTLPADKAEWLKEGLRQGARNTLELQDNRLNALRTQQEKVNTRLSRLYDAKLDGTINEEMFQAKEQEYKTQLIELKAHMDSLQRLNPRYYEDGCQTLELSKRLYSAYVKANYAEKAHLLKFIASNFILSDVTLTPTYRKPFAVIAKGLSCSNWLPRLDSNQD